MIRYVLQRTGYYVSLFCGVILFSFALFHVAPNDPARTILGPNATTEQLAQFRQELGLDQPHYVQLQRHLQELLSFDLGRSFVDGRDVAAEVWDKFQLTLRLIILALIFAGLYLAVILWSISRPVIRRLTDISDFILTLLPIFFSGVLVAILCITYYPYTIFTGHSFWGDLLYMLPAALVLALYPMAVLSKVLKKEMQQVMSSAYVRAERAMGYGSGAIVFGFALRNAAIPVLSSLSNILPVLLTGAFIVEVIFSLPGIGSLLVRSIMTQDWPMIEAAVIVNSAFFIVINLAFECIYGLIDPRIAQRRTRWAD